MLYTERRDTGTRGTGRGRARKCRGVGITVVVSVWRTRMSVWYDRLCPHRSLVLCPSMGNHSLWAYPGFLGSLGAFTIGMVASTPDTDLGPGALLVHELPGAIVVLEVSRRERAASRTRSGSEEAPTTAVISLRLSCLPKSTLACRNGCKCLRLFPLGRHGGAEVFLVLVLLVPVLLLFFCEECVRCSH